MDGVYPAPCLFMYTDELIHCQPVIISTGESAGNTSCIDFYNYGQFNASKAYPYTAVSWV